MMHKYWCHKSEALKSNCKKTNQLISIVDLDFRHAIHMACENGKNNFFSCNIKHKTSHF